MKKLGFLILILTLHTWCPAVADLDKDQQKKLFISHYVFQDLQLWAVEAWARIEKASETGELHEDDFEKDVFWGEILLEKLHAVHIKLKDIDKMVEDHAPAKILNQIVDLLELNKLRNATKEMNQLIRAKKIDVTLFWREEWVKTSSILIQLHYKYDWIFNHLYKEGYPENVDHDLLDDIFTLFYRTHPELPYMNRLHYTYVFIKTNAKQYRGSGNEQYSQTLDEVANVLNTTIIGFRKSHNLFVGLRELLKMHPDLVGPYKGVDDYVDEEQCVGEAKYAGMSGINYQIPIYVLMHILNAEMKYYILRTFTEMQRCVRAKTYNQAKMRKRVKSLTDHLHIYYTTYYTEMINAFKVYSDPVQNAPPAAWRWGCDPPVFEEDVNYARLYDFDTSFLIEERDISLTQTCRDSCDLFDGAFSSIPCEDDEWSCLETDDDFDCYERLRSEKKCPAPARKICPNNGLVCQTTKIKNALVCPGQSDKRYIEYVETDGSQFRELGNKTDCQNYLERVRAEQITERSGITKFEPQECEVCLCRCYEPVGNDSHRYLSITPQMANIAENRVIVGVRFLKLGNQIHISVADSSLSETGGITPNDTNWITPEPHGIEDATKIFRLDRESRSIYLDNIVSPKGYAITGIRMKPLALPVDRYHEREIGLQIHVTKIDENGKLVPDDSGWVFNRNDTRAREEIDLIDLHIPTLSLKRSVPTSKPNQFLKFRGSSIIKDVGQTPVPFFDTQPISFTDNGTLLRGIGLYLKRSPGYGGFLAFRLIGEIVNDIPVDPRYDLWQLVEQEDAEKNQGG